MPFVTLIALVKVSGNIGKTSNKKGKFIVGSFIIGLNEFEKSWNSLFVWMAENEYKKADRDLNSFRIVN